MKEETLKTSGAQLKVYRDAPQWDALRTACVGAFKCDDSAAGAALLQDVSQSLGAEGFRALIGPMDGDTWHSYRLQIESDDTAAFLMEPKSGLHDLEAFKAAGFTQIAQYFSARAHLDRLVLSTPEPNPEISIEVWDGQAPEALFGQVYDLSVAAFQDNLFYKPITRETFLAMYMPFVPMLRSELLLFARDNKGELVGFLFGIPNYSDGPQTKTVILKTYASLRPGIGHLLSHAFHQAAIGLGFEQVIHALIQGDNRSAERSSRHGAEIFRRYALMGKRLNG